jgi:hypothetical protein
MLTDDQLIDQLRSGLAPLRPRADLIERLREQAAADQHGGRGGLKRLHAAGRRRPRVPVGVLALVATCTVSIGIAVGALVLVRHRSTTPATASSTSQPTSNPARRSGHTPARRTTSSHDQPASVTAAQVTAPLWLRALPVADYCNAPAMRLVPCGPGQKPVVAQPQRLVQLTFTARRAAGLHSWYAWNLTAPPACPQASASGPTSQPVRKGARLVFENLLPPDCRGTVSATVFYFKQAPTPT